MPNVSGGYELTEAEVPQLRCELRGRDAALPEEARLRLRQFDDRRRAASLGRHVSKVLDEDQGNVLSEDGDHLIGVRNRGLPGQVRGRPRQRPLAMPTKLADELTDGCARRLLGPYIQEGARLNDVLGR